LFIWMCFLFFDVFLLALNIPLFSISIILGIIFLLASLGMLAAHIMIFIDVIWVQIKQYFKIKNKN
jgi:hypothetical protein